jgi:hypothetical protein
VAKRRPLKPVESSSIAGLDYDEETSQLYVRFHDNDATYVYHLVPRQVFEELMRAASMGAYLNQKIKPKYPVSKAE